MTRGQNSRSAHSASSDEKQVDGLLALVRNLPIDAEKFEGYSRREAKARRGSERSWGGRASARHRRSGMGGWEAVQRGSLDTVFQAASFAGWRSGLTRDGYRKIGRFAS